MDVYDDFINTAGISLHGVDCSRKEKVSRVIDSYLGASQGGVGAVGEVEMEGSSTILWLDLTGDVKGPVQSKLMFISIDQLLKMIEFHTIILHNYSSVDFIFKKNYMLAAILKKLKFL